MKEEFTSDDDVFRLDERVLKLGMIWPWKANKGQAYAEDMVTYEDALAVASGNDKGSTSSPSARLVCRLMLNAPSLE